MSANVPEADVLDNAVWSLPTRPFSCAPEMLMAAVLVPL